MQLAEGELDAALEAVWRGEQALSPVMREGPKGEPEVIAEGYEYPVAMSQQVDEQGAELDGAALGGALGTAGARGRGGASRPGGQGARAN